jgi:hypothetical protein
VCDIENVAAGVEACAGRYCERMPFLISSLLACME